MIAPDDLTLVSIMDTVLAFGSFERFLETMLQSLDAHAKFRNEVGGKETKALRRLAEISQMAETINQVMLRFTQDPAFSIEVNRALVKIIDRRAYMQILAAEMKSKTRLDPSFQMIFFQIMQFQEKFNFLALVIRAAKEVGVQGVKTAAAGGRTARETWTIKGHSDESDIPVVEQQFNAAISDSVRMTPEELLEKAAKTLEYVGRVKANKK